MGGGILEVLKIAKYELLDPYGPLGTPKPLPGSCFRIVRHLISDSVGTKIKVATPRARGEAATPRAARGQSHRPADCREADAECGEIATADGGKGKSAQNSV